MADVRQMTARQRVAKARQDGEAWPSPDDARARALVAACRDAMRLAVSSGRLGELLDARVPLPARSREIWANEREKWRRERRR